MGIRRRQALVTLAGSVVALGGCRTIAAPTGPAPSTDAMDPRVDAILDRRTRALAAGDEAAWLSAVDGWNPALVARERVVFANLRRLRPATARFRRLPLPSVAATPGRYAGSLPVEASTYEVELAVQLTGVDTAPAAVRHRYAFGRVDGVVTLVDAADVAGPEAGDDQPWAVTPLRVRRSGDVLLATEAGVADVDSLLATAVRASRELRRDWGTNPAPAAFAVFVAASRSTYRAWFGGVAPDWSDGVTVPLRPVGGDAPDGRYAGARIAVDLTGSRNRARGSTYETIKRQLAHALSVAVLPAEPGLRALPGPGTDTLGSPLWAVDGFAAYLTGRDSSAVRRRHRKHLRAARRAADQAPDLPGNAGFHAAATRDANTALGCSVFEFVAGRHGHGRAVALYLAAVARRTTEARAPAAELAAALAEAGLVGRGDDQASTAFAAQWRRYVERS